MTTRPPAPTAGRTARRATGGAQAAGQGGRGGGRPPPRAPDAHARGGAPFFTILLHFFYGTVTTCLAPFSILWPQENTHHDRAGARAPRTRGGTVAVPSPAGRQAPVARASCRHATASYSCGEGTLCLV